MTAPPHVVVELIGSPLTRSNTGAVAEDLVDALVAAGLVTAIRRDVIELAAISGITFTTERAVGRAPMADPFGVVRAADLLIVATPTLVGAPETCAPTATQPRPRPGQHCANATPALDASRTSCVAS